MTSKFRVLKQPPEARESFVYNKGEVFSKTAAYLR